MEKNENKGRIKMLRKVKRQMKSVIEGVALRKKQKMLFYFAVMLDYDILISLI